MSDQYVPLAGLCAECRVPLRPSQPYSFRELLGLEQVSRTGGVGTKFGRKEYTGRVFCRDCGDLPPQKETLF